ncbi:MAG: nitroreductase [Alphaproteobacteria bacterium]|nr:nitroreductase [Alphaproteobacteria bacterium]|tara:strand:+ start:593 stop:1192 length:600 start_codon:yes stop_codon:yes gene_type:complete
MAEADPHNTNVMLDGLINRNSTPPRLMVGGTPPPRADVERMLAAACSAPDHGAVRPWRFHIIEGEARNKLGDLFGKALLERDPFAPSAAIEKEQGRPLRAPMIIAVCAKVDPSRAPKVPVIEQVVAAAAAMEHLVLAAQAMGYGAIVLTGRNAHDPLVRAAFDLADEDELVGFVYLGSTDEPPLAKDRPDPAEFTSDWT